MIKGKSKEQRAKEKMEIKKWKRGTWDYIRKIEKGKTKSKTGKVKKKNVKKNKIILFLDPLKYFRKPLT